jgi:hypothetical protein
MKSKINSETNGVPTFYTLREEDMLVRHDVNTKDAISPLLSKEKDATDDKGPANDTE